MQQILSSVRSELICFNLVTCSIAALQMLCHDIGSSNKPYPEFEVSLYVMISCHLLQRSHLLCYVPGTCDKPNPELRLIQETVQRKGKSLALVYCR
jgi:hypothetical protein